MFSVLLCLAIAPAALADSNPTLKDSTTNPPAAVGDTITLTQGSYMAEDPTGSGTIQDTWYDCDTAAPTTAVGDCVEIQSGNLTYHVASADQTRFSTNYIVVFESDSVVSASVRTTPSILVLPPAARPSPPVNSFAPMVTGTTTVGSTLTAVSGGWTGAVSLSYSWSRCASGGSNCVPVTTSDTTNDTYVLTSADLGAMMLLTQTATGAGGSQTADSQLYGPVTTAAGTVPTQTTLQISPANVTAGQRATLIATVTSATSQASPTGAITFEHEGAAIPGCASITTHPVGASATVTCQQAFAGSSAVLSAVFTPTPGSQLTGSDSAGVGLAVARAATVATMTLPAQVTLGQRLELTAKVTPPAGTAGVSPTGAVEFLDGQRAIKGCTATLDHGVARCAVTYTALGKHSISAVYPGDGNFSGSTTDVHPLAVVVPKPTGYVSSLMTWTFDFEPSYTQVTTLAVTGVHPGLTISVDCSGRGCPKHGYVDTIARAACGKRGTCENVNLAKRLGGRKLGVGARLTVRLTHPGWLGKYYSFVVRRGRKPQIDTACLAVGQAKPGARCTPQ